jgi:hypothetical protein
MGDLCLLIEIEKKQTFFQKYFTRRNVSEIYLFKQFG